MLLLKSYYMFTFYWGLCTRNKTTSSFAQILMACFYLIFFFQYSTLSLLRRLRLRSVCVLSVYFIINFKRGLTTTRTPTAFVKLLGFFSSPSIISVFVLCCFAAGLAAFVITFCGLAGVVVWWLSVQLLCLCELYSLRLILAI